jgi:predicted RNA-binding Zn-ribbon protein involved in translation (DUF1610 family)
MRQDNDRGDESRERMAKIEVKLKRFVYSVPVVSTGSIVLSEHKLDVFSMPSMHEDPEFYARIEQIWCWTCGKFTAHQINWRWGGTSYLCPECGNIVVVANQP